MRLILSYFEPVILFFVENNIKAIYIHSTAN